MLRQANDMSSVEKVLTCHVVVPYKFPQLMTFIVKFMALSLKYNIVKLYVNLPYYKDIF